MMLGLAVSAGKVERQIEVAQLARADQQAQRPATPRWDPLGRDAPSARAALARSVSEAAAAFATTGREREADLATARANIALAQTARPDWPEALVANTFIDFVEGGVLSPNALRHFAASYQAAAFLPEAAPWRISFGVEAWPSLDAGTRRHVLEEAVWQAEISPAQYALVRGLFRLEPADTAFETLLEHSRRDQETTVPR